MEALGTQSISRVPMGEAMLSEYRELVYAVGRYILLLQNFFRRYLSVGTFLSLFLFGFFCESTHYEKKKQTT